MELLIDLGNTRTKWALNTDKSTSGEWQASGYAASAELLFADWQHLPRPAHICGCAVGSNALQEAIRHWCLEHWQLTVHWLKPSTSAAGLYSDYDPQQLGSDRWAALIGARHAQPDCGLIVVSAGTACVIDALSRRGQFLGGYILPGYYLQRLALHQHTARLPLCDGQYQTFPRQTADAIASGCLTALTASVEHLHADLTRHDGDEPLIILSGGDAAQLADKLNKPVQLMDNLALHGLAALRTAGEGVFLP